MDFLARGGGAFDGGGDEFQFLHDDGFDFEELVFIFLGGNFLPRARVTK